ncbi:twitch domain-containing radical SAM protein [bacterium]|nr:twitch domain-containing radical SAM protein [bacterium]
MKPDTSVQTLSSSPFSSTWCVLPWVHAASLTDGSTQLCCVAEKTSGTNLNSQTIQDYWNSDYTKSVRLQMLQGKKIAACRRCYEEEANGYQSHRLMENKNWQDKLGLEYILELIKETSESGELSKELLSVDLRLGNTCNLQCIMCQPRESSKWISGSEKLLQHITHSDLKSEWKYKQNIKVDSYEWYKNDAFWVGLKKILPYIKEIIIAGGEPMLIRQHLQFLKECADSGEAHHIHVRYHTNLIEFPVDMIPYWEKFERIEFFASVDGCGEVAHYLRYPTDWSKIEKNLRIIDDMSENTWLRFLFSVQALNVSHLPDFVRWVREQQYKKQKHFSTYQEFVHPGLVHWPEYLNPKVLPKNFKASVAAKFEALRTELNEPFDKFGSIVAFMNSEDQSNKLNQFSDYCSALDLSRKTDRFKTFPEFKEVF